MTINRTIAFGGEAFQLTPSGGIADGRVYVIGDNGDVDPGRLLADVEIRNTGTRSVIASIAGLRGAVGTTAFREVIPAGKSSFIPGVVDSLCLYNTSGSGGACDVSIVAKKLPILDSSASEAHPGHGEFVFRPAVTANTTVNVTRTLRQRVTVTGVYVWTKTKPGSALGGYTMAVLGGGVTLLSTATVDLETALSTATLYSATLTATTANLTLDIDDVISISLVSDHADLSAGDITIAIAYTVA